MMIAQSYTIGGAKWVYYIDFKMPSADCPGYIRYSHSPALQAHLDYQWFMMLWQVERQANLERIKRLEAYLKG